MDHPLVDNQLDETTQHEGLPLREIETWGQLVKHERRNP